VWFLADAGDGLLFAEGAAAGDVGGVDRADVAAVKVEVFWEAAGVEDGADAEGASEDADNGVSGGFGAGLDVLGVDAKPASHGEGQDARGAAALGQPGMALDKGFLDGGGGALLWGEADGGAGVGGGGAVGAFDAEMEFAFLFRGDVPGARRDRLHGAAEGGGAIAPGDVFHGVPVAVADERAGIAGLGAGDGDFVEAGVGFDGGEGEDGEHEEDEGGGGEKGADLALAHVVDAQVEGGDGGAEAADVGFVDGGRGAAKLGDLFVELVDDDADDEDAHGHEDEGDEDDPGVLADAESGVGEVHDEEDEDEDAADAEDAFADVG